MTVDYIAEWSIVTADLIPEWFYSLSPSTRNDIIAASQVEYESLTAAKNVIYDTYFANLIAPYAPP